MDDDTLICRFCEGEATYMGTLGSLAWYRCRRCGGETSQSTADRLVEYDSDSGYWEFEG